MAGVIRVVIADDHPVLRAGVRGLLRTARGIRVVGEAATGQEAVEAATALRPDVVVMDLIMPGVDGIEATRRIIAAQPTVKVLAFTGREEAKTLLPVLEAGGSGYVTKTCTAQELAEAIRTVARGEVFLYASGVKLLLQGYREQSPQEPPRLSQREREVLVLTAEGHRATEIARKLDIKAKTVETYRARIMRKLGLHRRSELVRYALDRGLLAPS